VGPRAVLDAVVKRKIPSLLRESTPRTPIFQPVTQLLKLFICLTKYCPMNAYPVLNHAPCSEDVLQSGGIATRILILGSGWR
jgi:hypothetical protein